MKNKGDRNIVIGKTSVEGDDNIIIGATDICSIYNRLLLNIL